MLRPRLPEKLKELIEKFRLNETHYKSDEFLETQVRVEFINPLLRLLGWDVDNEAGHAQEYKDVIHELHSGHGKHIDYVFKVGNEKKFLIEAKRPKEAVQGNKEHAHQAKLYAREADIPLVLVTDFEELAIYQGYRKGDGEAAPEPTDAPEARLVFFCLYTDYAKYWSFLYSLLSKKSVMLGLHDHLLRRLEEVKANIQKSVYSVREFNLLYSIAQSFGGEDFVVEQDQALPRRMPAEPELPLHKDDAFIRLAKPTTKPEPARKTEFYLAPVYS